MTGSVRDLGGGVDLVTAEGRDAMAERVLGQRDALVVAGIRLLRMYLNGDFVEGRGTFDLFEIEVRPSDDAEPGDVVLSYAFTGAEDPETEGYTVFDVGFRDHGGDRPLWPFRFEISFR